MTPDNYYELFELIASGICQIPLRKQAIQLRKNGFISQSNSLSKTAFDTRRINQEVEYNPRRGLQSYHRSENFISEGVASKIKAFAKLALVLDKMKEEFGKQPEWQDSYTRVLASSVHKGLRTTQLDGDYSDAQPSMASLNYLEELMFVRYRLTPDNLLSLSDADLRKVLLCKDEILVRGDIMQNKGQIITTADINKLSYDQMVDKVLYVITHLMSAQKQPEDNLAKLFDVKATKENPNVQRTITITINDKIKDEELQKISQTQPIKGGE